MGNKQNPGHIQRPCVRNLNPQRFRVFQNDFFKQL